jgi:NAD(P)-dependent dehydrogenase (short-subunit alcohol dehydrogenase family)
MPDSALRSTQLRCEFILTCIVSRLKYLHYYYLNQIYFRKIVMNDDTNPGAPVSSRHAVVTGGARGIGVAVAERLCTMGATLTLMGRDEGALKEAVARLPGSAYQLVDVTNADSVKSAFAAAADQFGPVEILINNAGAAESAPFEKTTEALWDRMLAVNLTGQFLCQLQVLPPMRSARWGRIVNIVSTAGLIGYAYVAAYCAAKHGAIGLTRALALETARSGITVNAICPGFTETDLLEESIQNIITTTGRTREEAEKSLKAVNPQRRFIQPSEIAATVDWLCSPGAESVTGQSIAIAGGEVM